MPLNQLSTNVWQLDMEFDGGTAELFKFPTGAPFVGAAVPEPGAAVAGIAWCAVTLARNRRRT